MHRFVLSVAFFACTSPATAQYEVSLAPGSKYVTLSLELPSGAKEPVKLAPRGMLWGLQPQVSDVQCNGNPLPRDADGNWVATASCSLVTWHVLPDRIGSEGADASKQRTLEVGRDEWVLLAEPTSLLRPHGSVEAMAIRSAQGSARLGGSSQVNSNTFRVPPVNSAPEFYVLGNVEFARRKIGNFDVYYVADELARVKEYDLEAMHALALSYLLQVAPVPQSSTTENNSLLVVWLGVTESRGRAGGAAGSRSFVANYIIGSSEKMARNAAVTMMITAHEQFHQLVDITRGDRLAAPFAAWLNESLAHYYGLKALLAANSSLSAKELWAKFIDLQRPVKHGLLELNRRYKSGDQTVYTLFYSQGATFWHALDRAIATATDGKKQLDDYLADLLHMPAPENGSLPVVFVENLNRIDGSTIKQVMSKYVGQ